MGVDGPGGDAERERQLQARLAEYTELKAEQRDRIAFRDHLVYLMLAVMGVVLAFGFENELRQHTALVIPWVGLVLTWRYVLADMKISAIGTYIRDTLAPALGPEVFGWERRHGTEPLYRQQKAVQVLTDLGLFALLPYGLAVSIAVTAPDVSAWVIVGLVVDALVAVAVAVMLGSSLHARRRQV